MAASSAPSTEVIFLSFLLNALRKSWESVRSNLEMQVGNMTEDWLCAIMNDQLFFTSHAS